MPSSPTYQTRQHGPAATTRWSSFTQAHALSRVLSPPSPSLLYAFTRLFSFLRVCIYPSCNIPAFQFRFCWIRECVDRLSWVVINQPVPKMISFHPSPFPILTLFLLASPPSLCYSVTPRDPPWRCSPVPFLCTSGVFPVRSIIKLLRTRQICPPPDAPSPPSLPPLRYY